MARPKVPTIPDDKLRFFREQLFRELAHMFEWEGLPQTVPADYLERNLIRHGYVLFYEDEEIGHDILRCEVTGYNRHDLPVQARTFSPNTVNESTTVNRNIKRLADSQNAVELFDRSTDGVLITNTGHYTNTTGGNVTVDIVNFYAHRLALVQQSLDTNLMWTNLPYIFKANDKDMRLSIEKMFASIFNGEPFIITDESMFTANEERAGVPTQINFIGKELMDIWNEIMMKFREAVGFETAGVEKAERVNTLEIKSNNQHTLTVLQIMLQQRQMAAEAINAFFGTNISVKIRGTDEGGEDLNGTGDSRTEEPDGDDEL